MAMMAAGGCAQRRRMQIHHVLFAALWPAYYILIWFESIKVNCDGDRKLQSFPFFLVLFATVRMCHVNVGASAIEFYQMSFFYHTKGGECLNDNIYNGKLINFPVSVASFCDFSSHYLHIVYRSSFLLLSFSSCGRSKVVSSSERVLCAHIPVHICPSRRCIIHSMELDGVPAANDLLFFSPQFRNIIKMVCATATATLSQQSLLFSTISTECQRAKAHAHRPTVECYFSKSYRRHVVCDGLCSRYRPI